MRRLFKLKKKKDDKYVVMDPRDNSVTLSPALFASLGGFDECHRVYVFQVAGSDDYAFIVNPDFPEETQISDVQVNTKTKEVGFECLIPSVPMMFARWGFDLEAPRRFPVLKVPVHFDFGAFYEFDHSGSVPV